jgi:hypothetical protein
MKRITAIMMALLSLCFVFAACGTSVPEGSAAKPTKAPLPEGFHAEPATYPPDFFTTAVPEDIPKDALLFVESFSHGGGGSVEKTTWRVYEDLDSFRTDYPEAPQQLQELKAEDFDSMVLLAISDVVRSGGFTLELASLDISEGVIYVDCKKEGPPKGTMVTMAFQTNTLILGIAKSAAEPGISSVVTVNGMQVEGQAVK